MEPIYKHVESTEKPLSVEMMTDCVYLRQNIDKIVRTDNNDNNVTYWTYQEACLTLDEFNSYVNTIAARNTASIDDILTQTVAGSDNQLAIMEALADLYDAITTV